MRLLIAAAVIAIVAAQELSLRHTFQAPYTADSQIPFWEAGAGAKVKDDFVELTPAKQSRSGFMWNSIPSELTQWEVEIKFQVTGMPRMGGDGFAFWYTEKPRIVGPVYGSVDYWNGLGIFFDTFNNDAAGEYPSVVAVINDGRLKYDSATDGASQALASCAMQFRQLNQPSCARIRYAGNQLSLSYSLDCSSSYRDCFTVPSLELGVDKYFGVTAATGDLADNHHVFHFKTSNLSPANVNLREVRERYLANQHAQSRQEVAANEAAQSMDIKEFQSTVINQLNQIQSSQNLMEMSQIAIGNLLDGFKNPAAGPTTSREAPREQVYMANSPNAGNNDGAVAQDTAYIRRVLDDGLRKLNDGQRAMMEDDKRTNDDARRLGEEQKRSIETVTRLGSTVNTLLDDTRNVKSNVEQTRIRAEETLAKLTTIASALESGGGGGGGTSWLGAVFYMALGALMGIGGMMLRSSSSRNAYKLP